MSMYLDTISALIDNEHNLRAYCNSCSHCAKLDLEALAERLGRKHSTLRNDLVAKLRCSACGSKDIALILSSQSTEGFGHV